MIENYQYFMDFANACFEGFGSIFVLNHARVLMKHKIIRGVSVLSVAYFALWGVFNMFYYSHLEQAFSWYAGIAVLISNAFYLSLIVHYRRKECKNLT